MKSGGEETTIRHSQSHSPSPHLYGRSRVSERCFDCQAVNICILLLFQALASPAFRGYWSSALKNTRKGNLSLISDETINNKAINIHKTGSHFNISRPSSSHLSAIQAWAELSWVRATWHPPRIKWAHHHRDAHRHPLLLSSICRFAFWRSCRGLTSHGVTRAVILMVTWRYAFTP